MKRYVAGWDGGGTKTAVQVRDFDGKVLLATESGGLNFNSYTQEELKAVMEELIGEMARLPGGLEAYELLCIAVAGISNPLASDFLKSTLRNAGLTCELMIVGDQEGALYGALGNCVGLVLVSGTGSICFGKNEAGAAARAGGWGHIIDDGGSGYAIGRDILSAAVQSYDHRIPRSILYDLVLKKIGGKNVEDIIKYTYQTAASKKDIADFAPLLIEALIQEDLQAIQIGDRASTALSELVPPVAQELKLEQGTLAFTGGILTHYTYIREQVANRLKQKLPGLQILESRDDNITGVTLMALDLWKKRRKQ